MYAACRLTQDVRVRYARMDSLAGPYFGAHATTQELDWLKEASLLDVTADVTGDVSGLGLGGDDDDVPDWLKD